ncbi:AAA family ATPase [Periweissella cryptocerci]|nr:AAA family ATPase [Periweissella cryptocerci]
MRKKIAGNRIGVYFGTFAPFHIGHYSVAMKAKRQNDGAVVIASGRDDDRGTKIGLGVDKRFRYVREVFRNDELVAVGKLNESQANIPAAPHGWPLWLDEVEKQIKTLIVNPAAKLTFYVGEADYAQRIRALRPQYEVEVLDRSDLKISATEIRKDPMKNWNYITTPFRRHFSKHVLISGGGSVGKTTLVQDLARSYGSPYSLEYARDYQEKNGIFDEELTAMDYQKLLLGQYNRTSSVINGSTNNGLVFADTNSTATKAYMDYYLAKTATAIELEVLDGMYQNTIAQEQWDLIIIVPPYADYYDDGVRDMNMGDQHIRELFTQHLVDLFRDAGLGDKLVILDSAFSEADPHGYYGRFKQAQQLIAEHLHINLGNV